MTLKNIIIALKIIRFIFKMFGPKNFKGKVIIALLDATILVLELLN